MRRYWKILAVAVVVVIAAVVQLFFVNRKGNSSPNQTNATTPLASTTVPAPAISDPSGAGYTVTQLPMPKETSAPTAPNVEQLVAGITPANDYEKIVFDNLTKSIAALKADSGDYNAWLTVGMSLKQLERFTAARDVLLYITVQWPTEAVSYGNLGSLYHLYLKDFPRAETAYKRAIELDPHQPAWYRGLYELYRYSYRVGSTAWEDTLINGIKQTEDSGLLATLAGRYAELSRFAEAVPMYDRAIVAAEKEKDSVLVDRLIGYRAAARAKLK